MASLCVLLPLLGSIIAGLFAFLEPKEENGHGGPFKRPSQLVTCGALVLSAICAIVVFVDVAVHGNTATVEWFSWIRSDTFDVAWALRLDTLSTVMMLTVTLVAASIHIYSIGYMDHDASVPRFMAYLNLFTFFMLMLVTSDNLVQLYFGWEGVGVASYLLIGFWYDRPSANAAAIKAFVVNRVGDFGFALGIFATFVLFDSVQFSTIFAAAPDMAGATLDVFGGEFHALTVICLLLFMGAMGKSAQMGLHTWLPDAMEGPTPVSALIHAATMVTAGVFMVARMSPLFELSETALAVVTIVGASTALFAASIGCVQNDIKRVIAYSTCSQLGYMFFACGVSAYSAGIFHLMTHAYFKALLFLGAGCVIHALSDEQDMRRMGGLWKLIPWTFALMVIGSWTLLGLPPFSGYFSKEFIIEAAYGAHTAVGTYAFWMGVAAAFLTAFYSTRLICMTFFGTPRADETTMAHVHESPLVMLLPVGFLAVGAIFTGWTAAESFVGEAWQDFFGFSIAVLDYHPAMHEAHHVPTWAQILPMFVGFAGIALALAMYMVWTGLPAAMAERFRSGYLFLLNKWYFDELYDFLFVRPAFRIGRGLWKGGDGALIDGVGPDGIAASTVAMARRAGRLESGYVYHYAFAMLIGVLLILTGYMLFSGV